LHVVTCIAPAEIMADRFMPPLVVRSMITPDLKDISESSKFDGFSDHLDVHVDTLQKILGSQAGGLRVMLEVAQKSAALRLTSLIESGLVHMSNSMDLEIERLEQLMKVNENVRPEELDYLKLRKELLTDAIQGAGMRMDAVRVLVCA
jgi:ATP-dependent helicase HepA